MAPALVCGSSVAGWRFGPAVGGWLSALPVIAGPVLLVTELEHGERFAADAAGATLLGLVALSLFIVVYAFAAARARPAASLVAGWVAFFAAVAALRQVAVPPLVAFVCACGSFVGAAAVLPHPGGRGSAPVGGGSGPRELAERALVTAALVVALSAAVGALGPRTGGLLVAFPVLASILAAFTHAREGAAAAAGLLGGMVRGLVGFAGFCLVVAVALPSLGTPWTFALATLTALVLHGCTYARLS